MVDAEGAGRPVSAAFPGVPPAAGEGEFQLIADSAPVPIWVTGLDRRRSFVNRAYVDFLRVSYAEAVDLDWRTVLHPEDVERVVQDSIAGEASLQTFTLEGRFRRWDGAYRWLQSVSRPRWDAAGRHIGFIGVAHDVTEAKQAELALREREAQLSAFVNQATAGFAQVDLAGRFTLVNDRFCEIAGYTREALMARTMQSITHPDDLAANLPLFERAIRDGTPYTHEKRYVRPDGSVVWVNNSVAVIRRADDNPYGVLAVTIDVTQRREAEAALRKSEESIRLAVEGAGMATWGIDLPGRIGIWSPNRFDLLGLPRAPDLRGSVAQWLALVHPEDCARVRAAVEGCLDRGEPFAIEYRLRRADNGEERWLQSHGSRIGQDGDTPGRFVGVSFDVTERKHAEQELRASETRFRTIFEQANDFLLTLSLDQRITSVNPAVLAALGYAEDEMIGRPVADFMDAAHLASTRETLRAKLSRGEPARLNVQVRARSGQEQTWEFNAQLTRNPAGQPMAIHAIARDVTEARRLEAHQRLLIDELNHRVKNTLAIVQGIAQQTFKGSQQAADAKRAFEGRLAALSEAHNLLTREHWTPVSMTRIITDALAPHGGMTGRFALDGPELMLAPKTAISLALAMHELATNAIKHGALSQPEGRVAIRWSIGEEAGEPRLHFEWAESGGPRVAPPPRRGFGTRMIEYGLASELDGDARIEFAPEGLRCIVDAPLPETTA